MFRLFFRLYGFAFAVVALLFAISMAADFWGGSQVGTGNLRERFRPIFGLTERHLAAHPEDRWPLEFRTLLPSFGYPAELVALTQARERWRMPPVPARLLDEGRILIFEGDQGRMVALKRLADSGYALQLDLPGHNNRQFLSASALAAIELAVIALLIGLWVRPFWRDLTALNEAAHRVGEGDFSRGVALASGSPLHPLATALNGMQVRISQLLSAHRELSSAVSHEFRNPLMRLRFRHTMALDAPGLAAKDAQLAEMAKDLDHLDGLADELLTYARLERAEPDVRLEPLEVGTWVEDLRAEAMRTIAASGREVLLEVQASAVTIPAEPRYMTRAVLNLVNNAIRHCRDRVRVTIAAEAGRNEIVVEDDGEGVAVPDRQRIFEPFARLDASRDRRTGGVGMGLAIVRRIARWHGGEASVGSSPLGGARFALAWNDMGGGA